MSDRKSNLPASWPTGLFDDFRKEMDTMMERFFGDARTSADKTGFPSLTTAGAIHPAIDISENDRSVTLTAELPGMSEEEIDLTISDGTLTIKGEKAISHESDRDDIKLVERSYGSFQRSFRLPASVDEAGVEAKFDRGVLTVSMPKKPDIPVEERKIKVKA